ncbi:hypothetical protein [Streptomyces fradiae]|uniref:hypothetical protein n=1 Tax=Streptomyces fradiae TaxID=1906 RepID=UPI0036FC5DD7
MPEHYAHIGDAIGAALTHNTQMAARHARARAAENAPPAQPLADEMPTTWITAVADAIAHHGHPIHTTRPTGITIHLTPQQRHTLHADTQPYLLIGWHPAGIDWGLTADGTHTTHPQPLTDTTHPADIAHTIDRLLTTGQPT